MLKRAPIKKTDELRRVARFFMDMTTGNPISEDISPIADRAKDPAAFVLGRKVGKKGSGATIPERRKENVRKGPNARRK